MQWGVHLPHLGRRVNRDDIESFAREAERLQCHSIWVSDHVCWPKLADIASRYPYSDDGEFLVTPDKDWLDAIGTLFFVSAVTSTVRLATSVLVLPYRPPVTTAKQIASLDVLSGGRVILGVGVGWMAEEAAILGMPFDHRGKRADEQLGVFRTLFEDDVPRFDGEYYGFGEVGFHPKPVQQPLPIWIGGSSAAAFRRTARFGQAFHAAFQPITTVASSWRQVRHECEAIGRDPDELTLSLRVFLDPAGSMPEAYSLSGSAEHMIERLEAMRLIGVGHVLLDPVARGGAAARLDAVRTFMRDVAPMLG